MADTNTTNLSLVKPEVGASTNTWGGKINADLDAVDAIFNPAGSGTSVGLNVGTGKTLNVAGTLKVGSNTDTHILVANGTNFNSVAMSGAATISNSGVVTLGSGAVSNSNVSSSAAIDASKIADGSVSNTEFQYLNGVTSNIQTQLNSALTFTVNSWITSSEGDQRFYFTNSGGTNYKADGSHVFQNGSGTNRFSIDVSGNGVFAGDITAYGSPSDMSLKENVNVIDNALAKVNQLNGITYDLKSDGNRLTGLVAQDLQEVLPEAVYKHKNIDTQEEYLAIRYGNTVGLLVEAIKELSKEVKTLKEKH